MFVYAFAYYTILRKQNLLHLGRYTYIVGPNATGLFCPRRLLELPSAELGSYSVATKFLNKANLYRQKGWVKSVTLNRK